MLSHINDKNQPGMVDIGGKTPTRRTAHARAIVALPREIADAISGGEIQSPKGPVFQTAIVAGIMAAKKTSELIPMCHPIGLDDCRIEITPGANGALIVDCRCAVTHKTGVEMEALTGASVAALTIYDMCKGISHGIVVSDLRLIEKRGGKSDYAADA
jgi:cyclic pyranopterin phosphate synthase